MKKIDFNRNWEVWKEDKNAPVEGSRSMVNLPHDAMIYEERKKEASSGSAGGYFPGGRYVYRKTFVAPKEWKDQSVLLELEGVYRNGEVFLNGEKIGARPYGYSDFEVELEGLLYGGLNEIKVVADNSQCPNSRWYSGSGMYREANLYIGNQVHLAKDGIIIRTPERNQVEVQVSVDQGKDSGQISHQSEYEVQVQILRDGQVQAEGKGTEVTLTLENPLLWSDETPELYDCHVTLWQQEKLLDEETIPFGIRTLVWSTEGFFVNGKKTLLRGGCIHHDNGILGACGFADAEERRVRILKEAGFNAIRSSHNPMSKAMLRACDRYGVYVMDEAFDQWLIHKNPYDYGNEQFREWWQQDLCSMVKKDQNHPSVILYSIGNEISELGLPEGQEQCRSMVSYVKSLDSTRPVTAGVNLMLATMAAKGKGLYSNDEDKKAGSMSLDNLPTSSAFNVLMNKMGGIMEKAASSEKADLATAPAFASLDICGYNYASSRYKKEQEKHPERIIVGSETLPPVLYRNWQLVKKLPYVIGDFMWAAWDYLGEAGIGTIRYGKNSDRQGLLISAGSGVIDICGKPRPEVWWNRIIWGLQDKPAISVEPVTHALQKRGISMWRNTDGVESWSWNGLDGRTTEVTVYSQAAKVELRVNQTSYGRKRVKENKAVFPDVTYVRGTIEAIAYDNRGKVTGTCQLETALGKTELSLCPDREQLKANGQDLCFLEIDLVGENGQTKSASDQPVTVKVEGAGTLQALGSAQPDMQENFHSDTHSTYYGKALAVIRAGYEPGEIKVTVSGKGLADKEIQLQVYADQDSNFM